MNNKKWLIAGLSLAMAASLSVGLAACSIGKKPDAPVGPEHTHEYTKWQHDETQHWKICPADDAMDPAGKSAHNFVSGECECGAKEGEKHTHAYTEWRHDETQHWKVCPTDGAIDPAGKANHDFTNGNCECGMEKPDEGGEDKPVAELDTREFYVVGKGAGDLKNGTWNGPIDTFKFTKAEKPDADGYTVYTFSMTVYSDDEFKFIEKNGITQGTDDDGNPTNVWHDELVFVYDDLDESAAAYFKDVNGNIVVKTDADGVYEFTIRTKKDGTLKENKVTVKQTSKVEPLGVKAQYDMYIVGTVGSKIGCNWPSNYPAATMVADVAKYCYHLELQEDGETFSVLANLRTTDKFKVWNAKLGDKDAGYYPTGMNNDLTVKTNGWYVVSWKAGASSVTVTMHEHEYTAYAHDIRGTTQHWKVCSICGVKQEGSEEDHSYGTDGKQNCVCGVEPGWGDHVHSYTVWKKDSRGHQCWKVCADDNDIDPANPKALHTFDATGTCTRCGGKLAEMIDIYLSASTKLPSEAYLDAAILTQQSKVPDAVNNPHLTLDVATKTYSITMWLTAGEVWKPYGANQLDTDGVYDRFDGLYYYNETAKAIRSIANIELADGQHSGVYTVSWVFNANKFTVTPVSDHVHAYDDETTDETCNTCGYVRHFFKSEWTQTPNEHYHESTCKHEGLQKDYGLHDYGNDNTCDTCGYVKTGDYTLTFEASGEDGYVVSGYTFLDPSVTEIEIPAMHEEKPVIGIKDDAFYKDKDTTFANITKVTLPESLVTLGKDAFRGFTALATINLDKITTYGDYALSGTAITSITLPENVTVGTYLLYQCTSLTEATLPNSLTVIPERTFSGCSALTDQAKLHLGNAVTEFQSGVFASTGFTTFAIPSTVTALGSYLFNSSKMQSFDFSTLNEEITAVPANSFQGCTDLTSVTFGDKITTIGNAAFSGCTKLTTVTIPKQINMIYYNAFSKSGLKTVTFEYGTSGWKLGNTFTASTAVSVSTMSASILVSGKVGSTSGSMSKKYFCHA